MGYPFLPMTILAGNMNIHNPRWNSDTKSSKNHQYLLQIPEKGEFDLINIRDETTCHYSAGKGNSVIDLPFSSPDITTMISNRAADHYHRTWSDHEMITFDITLDSTELVPDPTNQR